MRGGSMRLDPEDGERYTREEFVEIYGTCRGAEEWAAVGFGRVVVLCYGSSTQYHIRDDNRHLLL
jgi:hypothetical protein